MASNNVVNGNVLAKAAVSPAPALDVLASNDVTPTEVVTPTKDEKGAQSAKEGTARVFVPAVSAEDAVNQAVSLHRGKTEYQRAKDELSRLLSNPFEVCKSLSRFWGKEGSEIYALLKGVGCTSKKDVLPMLFGRFFFDGKIHRKANKRDKANHPERVVKGLDFDGDSCEFVPVENSVFAYLAALRAIVKDSETLRKIAEDKASRMNKAKAKTKKTKKA